MTQYILSLNAQESLRKIKAYSLEHFGEEQTLAYLRLVENKLQTLAENPDIGRKREEVKKGYASYLVGAHVLFYRKGENYIDIIDILHQGMDPYRHLTG